MRADSNAGMITVGALFVVIGAVSKIPFMHMVARKIFGSGKNPRWNLFKQAVVIAGLSTVRSLHSPHSCCV